jgi:RNA polymerase sigma-54 factor
MSTGPAPELTPRLEMRVSPALVAYAEVLLLPASELDELVVRAADENPALELADPPSTPAHRAAADPAALAVAEPTLADTLLADARPALAPGDEPIAEFLLGNLDEHGFGDLSDGEVADRLGVSTARVRRVLAALRDAGPAALGACDLRACLLLQLDRIGREQRRDLSLARTVVRDHLPALARGADADIAAATGATPTAVAAVRRLLRAELQPYPLTDGAPATPRPPALVPDVAVAPDLSVTVRAGPALRLATPHRSEDAGDARALLARLEERRSTLHRVATAAVRHQARFVREGPAALRPLTRGELARALRLHESTVSRAVAGKHVMLPGGRVVAFGAFFGTGQSARDALARIVAAETRPLSDGELADALARRGFPLARRTVAKYRDGLGILPHALR